MLLAAPPVSANKRRSERRRRLRIILRAPNPHRVAPHAAPSSPPCCTRAYCFFAMSPPPRRLPPAAAVLLQATSRGAGNSSRKSDCPGGSSIIQHVARVPSSLSLCPVQNDERSSRQSRSDHGELHRRSTCVELRGCFLEEPFLLLADAVATQQNYFGDARSLPLTPSAGGGSRPKNPCGLTSREAAAPAPGEPARRSSPPVSPSASSSCPADATEDEFEAVAAAATGAPRRAQTRRLGRGTGQHLLGGLFLLCPDR